MITEDDVVDAPTFQAALAKTPDYGSMPPVSLMPTISTMVLDACKTIPEGQSGALIGMVNETGFHGAVVQRIDLSDKVDFAVIGWVGKNWAETKLGYGSGVRLTW